ncbi:MAG TPA: hypothetical protein VFZ01_01150, partial [Geminicoccaceae bacterium]
ERVRLALVIPHLQRALQLHRRVAVLRQGREVVQQALDRLPTGILFVDGECRPIARNHRADEILEAGDLVLRSGRLSACDEIATGELHRLIAACMDTANGDGTGAGGVLQICRAPTQPSLQVLVSPMRSMCDLLGHEESIAAVFVSDPGLPIDLEHERLCQLYGLSRVEAEFALRIVQGRSVEEASKSLRLAVNTGRAYLKRIFSKTGVHRQSDLVRLVLVGPAYPRAA